MRGASEGTTFGAEYPVLKPFDLACRGVRGDDLLEEENLVSCSEPVKEHCSGWCKELEMNDALR